MASLSVAITVSGVTACSHAARDPVANELEHAEHVPGGSSRGQIVGREIESLGQGLVVDVEPVVAGPVPGDFDRGVVGERREPDDLEQTRNPRAVLEHELVGARIDLPDDHGVARLDVREKCVQHAARALHVLAGPERLLEAREHPDDPATRETVDDLLHPRLEHPDERLPGVDVLGACLEREPLVSEPPERLEDQRRLADPGLADEQHGPGSSRRERTDERVDGPDPAADERRRRPFARIDDATELTEEVDVDDRGLPLLEGGPQGCLRRGVRAVDQLADERL